MQRLLLLAFIWGWSILFIKVAVEGMPPVADVGPTRASLVTYLVPLVAVTVGVVVLDEAFHLRVLAGGALIVGGIALVSPRRPAPASTEAPPALR